jgi:membrane protein involved in colicin uptake
MTSGSSSVGSTKSVKEATDAAAAVAVKKAKNETVAKEATAKKTTYAAAAKKVVDDVATHKATDDAAVVERVAKEPTALRAAEAETSKDATEELMGSIFSSAPVVGAMRITTPGGSTPPTKRFFGSRKPRYAQQFYNYFVFALLD